MLVPWILAIAITFFVANFLIAFYFYDPGWIKRDAGATEGIYEPGSMIVRADEGYTITYVDENGYINRSAELTKDGYILVMGNSQSNGNNVMPEKKWVSLLNDFLSERGKETQTQVYNISVGGYGLCDLLEGVNAATVEFPNSDALILQITTTDIPVEKLSGIQQRKYTDETRGRNLESNVPIKQKIRNGIKKFFPLVTYLIELKSSKINISFNNAFGLDWKHGNLISTNEKALSEELALYEQTLSNAMLMLKSSYPGEIIILNIPELYIDENGGLVILESEHDDIFAKLCEQNSIQYCHMGAVYQQNYEEYRVLPYVFINTTPGSGHLNEEGHKLVATALYELLEESGILMK